jgi:hypothetical protein
MSILRYFLFLLLPAFSTPVYVLSQNGNAASGIPNDAFDADSVRIFRPFIRLGVDISSVGRNFFEPEVSQYEFVLDAEFRYNWFAVMEGGFSSAAASGETYSYSSQGMFARLGVDYNLMRRPLLSSNDLFLVGLRYGYSITQHQAPYYSITNPYWGDFNGSVQESNFGLHFLEFSGGVRTEVFRNFFLGWNIKTRVRLAETGNSLINPYFIAGYGHGKRRAPVMAHFYMLYRINFR